MICRLSSLPKLLLSVVCVLALGCPADRARTPLVAMERTVLVEEFAALPAEATTITVFKREGNEYARVRKLTCSDPQRCSELLETLRQAVPIEGRAGVKGHIWLGLSSDDRVFHLVLLKGSILSEDGRSVAGIMVVGEVEAPLPREFPVKFAALFDLAHYTFTDF